TKSHPILKFCAPRLKAPRSVCVDLSAVARRAVMSAEQTQTRTRDALRRRRAQSCVAVRLRSLSALERRNQRAKRQSGRKLWKNQTKHSIAPKLRAGTV